MKNYEEINSFFIETLENMDNILNNDFYENKGNLIKAREKVQNWYDNFKNNKTLKNIEPKDLEFIDLEITDIFDEYIASEPVSENYIERLSYDFGHLEKYWKNEMLEGKENVRNI